MSEDIFPSDIVVDEKDVSQDTETETRRSSDINCTLSVEDTSAVSPDPSNSVTSSSAVDDHIPVPLCQSLEENTDSVVASEVTLPVDSVYATLSGSSNVLCLLSNDVPSPQSSMPAVNCPEGILIDLGENTVNFLFFICRNKYFLEFEVVFLFFFKYIYL